MDIPESAFQAAIGWLESSSVLLDKQNEALERQKAALQSMRKSQEALKPDHVEHSSPTPVKRLATLEMNISSLATELDQNLASSIKQCESMLKLSPTQSRRMLEKDDRVLSGVQKIMPRLYKGSSVVDLLDVDKLCETFISLERQSMRSRLDQKYYESLSDPSAGRKRSKSVDISAVEAELQELCNEIDGLVALIAEHHYRQYIKQLVDISNHDAEMQRSKWSEYVACVLLYLIAKIEAYDGLLRQTHAHKAALAVLESEAGSITSSSRSTTRPISRAAVVSKGLKPLRLVQATLSGNQKSTSQIFGVLNLDPDANENVLSQALNKHRTKLDAECLVLYEGLAAMRAASMNKNATDTAALLDAVLLHAESEGVQLVQPQVRHSIEQLQVKTDVLSKGMRDLDISKLAQQINML